MPNPTGGLDVVLTTAGGLEVVLGAHPALDVTIGAVPALAVVFGSAQGPSGPPGASGGTYTHTQPVAAASWTVNHNLGFRPAVSPLSVGGREMVAEVIHASTNQALVYFDSPIAGMAVCS